MNGTFRCKALAAALVAAIAQMSTAGAAGTFDYHGTLSDGAQPANGRYDLQISVYSTATATVPMGPAVTVSGVDVNNGSFNTQLDLGDAVQSAGWIGVAVRPAGSGTFTALSGRTPVTPGGTCVDSWSLDGNAGTTSANYLGTSDAVDLFVRAGGIVVAEFNATSGAAVLSPYTASTGLLATSVSYSNAAAGDYSFAGGYSGGTNFQGSFIWGDSSSTSFSDTTQDQFAVQAGGGVMFNTSTLPDSFGDVVVAPRAVANGGDDDADLEFSSRNGQFADIYLQDADGILQVFAPNGVHVSNPVEITDTLKTQQLRVQGNATKATAGAWKANSDARIKQNIQPISNALDTLMKVQPVTFEYTQTYRADHPGIDEQRYYNVIAQQFAEVFPEAVTGSGEYLAGAAKTPDNEILQVDTYPAQIVTIAAVQELAQKNAELQHSVDRMQRLAQQNATLQSTVDALLARVEKLEAAQGK
jgi:hypothetical protein